MFKSANKSISSEALKKQLKGCKNVKILNEFKVEIQSDVPVVYRYMKYAYAKEIAGGKIITLVSPDMWEDPFERRFFEGDYSKLSFQKQPLACTCFSLERGENEAAAWKFYGQNRDGSSDGDCVQLKMDFTKLLKSLDKFAKGIGATVYVEAVNYQYTRGELELQKQNPCLNGAKKLDDEKFIRLLEFKRHAFQFENELRIFVYGKNVKLEDGLLKIPVQKGTIKTLKLNPTPSLKAFLNEKIAIKELVKKEFPELNVVNSRLYDEIQKFKPGR